MNYSHLRSNKPIEINYILYTHQIRKQDTEDSHPCLHPKSVRLNAYAQDHSLTDLTDSNNLFSKRSQSQSSQLKMLFGKWNSYYGYGQQNSKKNVG